MREVEISIANPYEHVHDGPGKGSDCPACIFADRQVRSDMPKRIDPTAEELKARVKSHFGDSI
jgi:hypothetical protein